MLGEEGPRRRPGWSHLADGRGLRARHLDLQTAVQSPVLDRQYQRYLLRPAGREFRPRLRGRSWNLRRAGAGVVGRAEALSRGDFPAPGLTQPDARRRYKIALTARFRRGL